MRSIFWFDPGVHTGVAWCTVDIKSRTVADALRDKINFGSATIETPSYQMSDAISQAKTIFKLWVKFKREAVTQGRMELDWLVLGAENFVLVPGRHAPGIEGIFPTYVLGAFEGYRHGLYDNFRPRTRRDLTPLILQTASVGLRYNKQKFLKPWDCWVVGKEHERAAWSHIGAYLMGRIR